MLVSIILSRNPALCNRLTFLTVIHVISSNNMQADCCGNFECEVGEEACHDCGPFSLSVSDMEEHNYLSMLSYSESSLCMSVN